MIAVPIQLNIPLGLEFREEIGFLLDLWVPAGDALNYAVAAARKGTISTRREIPATYFEQEFVPEKPSLTGTYLAIGLLKYRGEKAAPRATG